MITYIYIYISKYPWLSKCLYYFLPATMWFSGLIMTANVWFFFEDLFYWYYSMALFFNSQSWRDHRLAKNSAQSGGSSRLNLTVKGFFFFAPCWMPHYDFQMKNSNKALFLCFFCFLLCTYWCYVLIGYLLSLFFYDTYYKLVGEENLSEGFIFRKLYQ